MVSDSVIQLQPTFSMGRFSVSDFDLLAYSKGRVIALLLGCSQQPRLAVMQSVTLMVQAPIAHRNETRLGALLLKLPDPGTLRALLKIQTSGHTLHQVSP